MSAGRGLTDRDTHSGAIPPIQACSQNFGMKKADAVVVGSGFAGLAAAIEAGMRL
jgi:NADPH-dependent 2,4-dienoyl-CoA reductase/sulfur reductase-like enzyme